MSLDEYLFGKAARYFSNRKRTERERLERTVHLDKIKSRLVIIARAATGLPIEIYAAEKEGGYRNENFFLPATIDLFPTRQLNIDFCIFRVLYMAVQKSLQQNWSDGKSHNDAESLKQSLATSEIVLKELYRSYPYTEELYSSLTAHLKTAAAAEMKLPDYSMLFGKWMTESTELANGPAEEVDSKLKHANTVKPKTVLKAKAVEAVANLKVDKKQQEDYVLTHNFEKVETADEFNGVWRDFDGDDQLEDHQDALSELTMRYTVRVDDTAHSVYQSDFLENMTAPDVAETSAAQCILYNEWDYRKRNYKRDFCKLYPLVQKETDAAYYQKTIASHASQLRGLRKMFVNLQNKRRQQRRQSQGAEFDLDAVTDLFTEIRSGHTPHENVYLSSLKKESDVSILLLLDGSLSSDSFADGNHIIDVEKQAAIVLGEILSEFNIDFSVCSFFSKTRNYSSFVTLKDFDESWNIGKFRVGAIDPSGYTRIGPALRHSGELLDARPTKNKWVWLLSDGKPNDFDTYEGKYGIRDVQQALRELQQKHISSYAFAIEAAARFYLPQLFAHNYQVLSSTDQLMKAMTVLVEKVRRVT